MRVGERFIRLYGAKSYQGLTGIRQYQVIPALMGDTGAVRPDLKYPVFPYDHFRFATIIYPCHSFVAVSGVFTHVKAGQGLN